MVDSTNYREYLVDTGETVPGVLSSTILNWFTGNTDFARSFETASFQNKFNAEQARIQRDFEKEMSNTAYQRAVNDMQKAGLNPYLLYSSASPASTPAGATATGSVPVQSRSGKGFDVLFSLLSNLVGTAIQAGTSSSISASKISSQEMNNALRAQTQLEIARRAQFREMHHYNHKP